MKLLVTGAASFVGRELIRRCQIRGIEQVGIDANPDVRDTIIADIRDRDLSGHIPDDIDAVIHLAAISSDPACKKDPLACYDVNVAGTVNVFEAARAKGARQFIFASTEWVYDEFDPRVAKSEDDPIDCRKLTSDYALSKLAAESALRIRHLHSGMPVTVLRFGIIYGPRRENWSAVEALLAAVAGGDPVKVGARSTARCFLHVTDIADGILAAVGCGGYEIINLQADAPISLGRVIDSSAQLMRCSPDVVESAPTNPSIRHVSNAKAVSLLGWQPQIGLSDGLQSVADFLELGK